MRAKWPWEQDEENATSEAPKVEDTTSLSAQLRTAKREANSYKDYKNDEGQKKLQELKAAFNNLASQAPVIVQGKLKKTQANSGPLPDYPDSISKKVYFKYNCSEAFCSVTDESLEKMPEFLAFREQCKSLDIGWNVQRDANADYTVRVNLEFLNPYEEKKLEISSPLY